MTTPTLDRPLPGSGIPPGRPPTDTTRPASGLPPRRRTTVLAEAALTTVSLATVLGYTRLFADAGFLRPVAAAAVVAHLLAAALRRWGLGPVTATSLHLGALALFLTWTQYPSAGLVPSSTTLERLGDDLAAAWDIFLDVSAPVPVAPGFVVVAVTATWLTALAADGLAFRLHTTVEAIAPAAGLFLFSSVLAGDEHRVSAALGFVVAVGAFVLTARVARAEASGRWLATDTGRGLRSLLATGAALLAIATVVAAVAGPRLPGGDGEAVLDVDGAGSNDDRITLSPLVDIRSRLVEQSDIEAFRVEASAPAYWRLTALDRFDGAIWSSSGRYVDVAGRLPAADDGDPAAPITQSFRIGALAQIWLPAAYEPVAVDSPEADVAFSADTSTLVVGAERETADGLRYDVISAAPRIEGDDLRAGTAGLDRELLDRLTRLPAEVAAVASGYARQAVGAVEGDYGRALALQDWFRSRFTYDLDVAAGHGTDALDAFLDPDGPRAGYCEQFAGAYAALARALGLPARVAVGFTPGDRAPGTDTYVVRGRHAHAWPEVYFAGVGWVPFEPTPGRGAPGAESYTGVPAAQAADRSRPTPTTTPAPASGSGRPGPAPATDDTLPALASAPDGDRSGPDLAAAAGLAVAAAGITWVVGVPLLAAARRRARRRRAIGQPAAQVAVAWQEVVDAWAAHDLVPAPAETSASFTRRGAEDLGADRDAARRLAAVVDRASWGTTVSAVDVDRAQREAGVLVSQARSTAGWGRRLRSALAPRRLRR